MKQVIVTYSSETPWVVNQAMEAAEVCEGEPTNHQTSQEACPRKKSRSQSMTIIITLDQPSRHPNMRWLPNSSFDNFRMNTSYGRYGATYNMVGLSCFNDKLPCVWVELLLLPKNPTEAKLQATSTRGESTEPTKGVMKHTYKAVLYNYCLMQYCCILFYQLMSREGCNPNQWGKVSKSMDSSSIGNR
jgi:hypothetical protein